MRSVHARSQVPGEMPDSQTTPQDGGCLGRRSRLWIRRGGRSQGMMGGGPSQGPKSKWGVRYIRAPMDEVVEHLIKKSTGWSWRLR